MEVKSAEFDVKISSPDIVQVNVQSVEFDHEITFRRLLYFYPYGTPQRRSRPSRSLALGRRIEVPA